MLIFLDVDPFLDPSYIKKPTRSQWGLNLGFTDAKVNIVNADSNILVSHNCRRELFRSVKLAVSTFRLRNGTNLPFFTLYLTLSHCWVPYSTYTLLSSNIELLYKEIGLFRLPKVFQDALFVTELLGFRYLRTGSPCIIQDSEEDWLRGVPQMGSVYGNATCSLAATGFVDGRAGSFSPRETRICSCENICGLGWTCAAWKEGAPPALLPFR
jgi:Heterokaryon incompatibility protein (HET)